MKLKMPEGTNLAANLLSLQILMVIWERLGKLSFESSKFFQWSTNTSLTPLPVLWMTWCVNAHTTPTILLNQNQLYITNYEKLKNIYTKQDQEKHLQYLSQVPCTLQVAVNLSGLPLTRWQALSSARPSRCWLVSIALGYQWALPAGPSPPGYRPTGAVVCRPPLSGCSCPVDAAALFPSAVPGNTVTQIKSYQMGRVCCINYSESLSTY